MKRLAAAALALIALTTEAPAQQRTIYGADGRAIGRAATDTQGTTTLYGADGRAITRETKTRNGTTVYDAQSGRAVGKVTKERR